MFHLQIELLSYLVKVFLNAFVQHVCMQLITETGNKISNKLFVNADLDNMDRCSKTGQMLTVLPQEEFGKCCSYNKLAYLAGSSLPSSCKAFTVN